MVIEPLIALADCLALALAAILAHHWNHFALGTLPLTFGELVVFTMPA